MMNIKLYFYIFIFSFSRFAFGEFFLIDGNILNFKDNGGVNSKIEIERISDNDLVELKIIDFSDRVDIYDYNSSNASYSVSSIKYDHDKKSFIEERLEYVNNCSYCTDLKTEYCSINKPRVISKIDFQYVSDNAICYFTHEDKSKGSEFNRLSDLANSFNLSRQYMKSFSYSDIDEMLNRFDKDKNNNDIEYSKIIKLLKCEGEYSLLSYLKKRLSIAESGVIKSKSYLYKSPNDNDKSKLYLIKGDTVSILDEKSSSDKKWYLINYSGKKDINMWIKADSIDLN
ncbi:hypothetical protein [Aggregatibacter actinomycetemcomitans]|uniref:hypothetical protein n=1 Tax=Aggregatibacter actinomycetemcomitans TaxID=714 RepID=UPI00197C17D1|nr:hypothetical protein [Aggregatibacter actinomycetemcomitans]MBN6063289.1 hypothetical protein [Aggregatibacter actinomycetemcomitans]MBN6069953.1 hypothetical protein [Aggregatibacter actinomycetemcomitans]MBN6083235.1 hypothetical protein [Aggregatibacter actinomycetemcomitans]